MEKEFFIDTLFDIINESDSLEEDLKDIHATQDGLTITLKDDTVFSLTIHAG